MPLIRKRKIFLKSCHYFGGKKRTVIKSASFRAEDASEEISFCGETVKGRDVDETRDLGLDHCTGAYDVSSSECGEQGNKNIYESSKQSRIDDWKQIRSSMLDAAVSMETPQTETCCQCLEGSATYRCLDCCTWDVLCGECLADRHRTPHLHLFEAWKNETFISYTQDTVPWKLSFHDCNTSYNKSIVIVDDKGRQHTRILQFCKCEPEAVTLIRYNLWPSSAKFPRIAFHLELMKWAYGLLLESHVSLKSFCEALKARCSKHHRGFISFQLKDIYRILITETMDEFRHFFYSMENPGNLYDHLDKGTDCPACFLVPTKVYSFDADFQLVRKASSGKQWDNPKHYGQFFLDQNEVDNFIDTYNKDKKKPDVECSEFQAGSIIRSKRKNKKLSETAVFGSTCRHEFPKYFFSLKHGERLGYAVFLLSRLLEEQSDSEDKICIMYDIACTLVSHLQKFPITTSLEKVKFAIPIFHSYGHKSACQVHYGPRRTEGIGLTDGESLERLWSYLGKFSKVTKEMTPENRIDLLVDGLIHYGSKIKSKLGFVLVGKYEKAVMLEKTSTDALRDLLQPLSGVTDRNVMEWIQEDKTVFTMKKDNYSLSLSPKEEYSLAIENLSKTRTSEKQNIKKIENEMKKWEKKLGLTWTEDSPLYQENLISAKEKQRIEILTRLQQVIAERLFLLDLMKKYAKGQAVAIRLSKQVKRIGTKIQQSLSDYNSIGGSKINLPITLSLDDVKSQDCTLWQYCESSNTDGIPAAVKRQAVQLRCMIDRAVEEQALVKSEMLSCCDWYRHHHVLLQGAISCSDAGRKSLLVKECLFIENKLNELYHRFKPYIEQVCLITKFSDLFGITTHLSTSFYDGDILDDEEDEQEDIDDYFEDDLEVEEQEEDF